jgi:hypothetical protein
MFNRTGRVLSVILAGALGMGAALTASAADTPEDIRAEMQKLQEKLARVEAQQAQNNATIQKMIEDAGKRSQLLDFGGGANVGYDAAKGGFFIQDGPNLIHPWLQFQLRNTTNFRDDAKGDGDNSIENGFEIRRMKFGFNGTLLTKDLSYAFQWATGRKDGIPVLEDAWAKYKFNSDWAIKGGQFKDPFSHESWISSIRLMAAERSLMNDFFTGGDNYTQGVSLIWEKPTVRAEMAVTDGLQTPNQNFRDFPTNSFDFGVAGRVEWAAICDFKGYDEHTALRPKQNSLVFGAAVDYRQAGDTSPLLHTVDVMYKNTGGLSVYGAYIGRATDKAGSSTYDWGAEGQVAWAFSEKWEVFGRYDYLNIDSANVAAGAETQFNEVTVGVNRYFFRHNAKITLDLSYLPDGAPAGTSDGLGVIVGGDEQWMLRAQFQLLI